MKKRILLTGASGTVGYQALKQLLKGPYDISVFDRKTENSERLLNLFSGKINIFYGDITKSEDSVEATKNIDYVIHLAALIPPAADKYTELAEAVNVEGTRNLINNLEKHSPDAFFAYSSSVSVYGDRLESPNIKVGDPLKPSPGDFYAITKIKAEEIIQKSQLNWTIFRLSAIMGAGNHKVSGLMFHMPLETKMEITSPQDTARAFVKGIEHTNQLSGKIFNLGGGSQNRILYRDLLSRSFEIFGLGKLNFPENSFAKRNFHCGYYEDGDVLEEILHFRKDTLKTYFEKVRASVKPVQRAFTRPVSWIAKKVLLSKSEPYMAFRTRDLEKMKKYF